MKVFSGVMIILAFLIIYSCNSGADNANVAKDFCKADCGVDTIQAKEGDNVKSIVRINMRNCRPDSITWGNSLMENYRQMEFAELVGKELSINPDNVRFKFYGNAYAWLIFNECKWGQGYIIKLPFNKTDNIFRKSSAFNLLDRKYNVDTSMVAYTDRGNIFVEQMATGKKAMMTFGENTDLEYDAMHETVDSVSITPTHIWAKVRIGKEWKEIEKDITLE